jgi:diguanylate cyclase (GGDEF)-like protein/PAS domain S-box-containing protein
MSSLSPYENVITILEELLILNTHSEVSRHTLGSSFQDHLKGRYIMSYRFVDLVNIPQLQRLMRSFYDATGVPNGILDDQGHIISGVGWQDLCTKFHRLCPETLRNCQKSDLYINEHLNETDEPYTIYQCLNGLMDCGAPIIVEGQHLASVFTGQLLLEPPDEEFFRRQAQEHGFNETLYLEALRRVPIVSKEQIAALMDFCSQLAQLLASTGLNQLRQLEMADKSLKGREEQLRLVLEESQDGFWDWNLKSDEVYFCPRWMEMLGYSLDDLEPCFQSVKNLIHPDERHGVLKILDEHLAGRLPYFHVEQRMITRTGEWKWFIIRGKVVTRDKQGYPLRMVGTLLDITDRKQVEEALKSSEEKYRVIFENTGAAEVIIEEDMTIAMVNEEMVKIIGYSRAELEGKRKWTEFIVSDDLQKMKEYHQLRRIDPHAAPRNYEGRLVNQAGNVKDMFLTVAMIPGTTKSVASLLDITSRKQMENELRKHRDHLEQMVKERTDKLKTVNERLIQEINERKQVEERLKFLSFHDPLTKMYNRTFFEQEMSRLGREQYSVGIIVSDVDGLKLVNDTLGHKSGDQLLVSGATILKNCLRKGDMVTRIGGDEFACLLPQSDQLVINKVVHRIREAIEEYNKAHPELPLSMSIGFAACDGVKNMGELFKEADDYMYREKLYNSQSVRGSLVQTLMKTLEARDYITEGHGERLKTLVVGLARALGLPDSKHTALRLLAQFHDIGKVGVPDQILFKPGPLTLAETVEMRRHCEIGFRIAQAAPDLILIAEWILKHHEWWNGQGYPLGLKGDEIPMECRILAIADAYDAMTCDRPYCKSMTVDAALAELQLCSGSQFDPLLVQLFVRLVKESKFSTDYELPGAEAL